MTYTSNVSSNSHRIAAERDAIAESLSESQIHMEVISNVCNLSDVDVPMRCDIMLQSINDMGTIFKILKHFNEVGKLPDREYASYLQEFLRKVKTTKRQVEFDPRKFSSTQY